MYEHTQKGRGLAVKVVMIYNFFSITFIEYIQCI
jgi:hypothetical protein